MHPYNLNKFAEMICLLVLLSLVISLNVNFTGSAHKAIWNIAYHGSQTLVGEGKSSGHFISEYNPNMGWTLFGVICFVCPVLSILPRV